MKKTLQPVILVIGYNETEILLEAYLGSNGINTEKQFTLLGKMLGKFTDAMEANECFQNASYIYEYVEIKTVYQLS